MESNSIHSIADSLFQAMDFSCWKVQSLDQIELNSQMLVSQLANLLIEDFILRSRIKDIQQSVDSGQILCQSCGCKLRLHKPDRAIHPKTIFGEKITIFVASGVEEWKDFVGPVTAELRAFQPPARPR
jgi:hypothetical protein